jgi:hypothetical protein
MRLRAVFLPRLLSAFIICLSLITLSWGQSRQQALPARQIARRALSSLVLLVAQNSKGQRRMGTGFFVADDLVATNSIVFHLI